VASSSRISNTFFHNLGQGRYTILKQTAYAGADSGYGMMGGGGGVGGGGGGGGGDGAYTAQ